MKKKSLISILLVLVMLLGAVAMFSSCGDTGTSATTTAKTNTGDESAEDPDEALYPHGDYQEAEFRVYYRTQESSHYKGLYICPLEDSADVLDEVAETRNMRVEERYNIKFVPLRTTNPNSTISQDIAGGTAEYEVILAARDGLGTHALSGNLYNLLNLDIDYTTKWWDANCADNYAVNGKLYIAINDVSINNLCNINFFYFNKAVLEDFGLKSPYEYVQNNEWTIDTLFGMMKGASSPATDGGVGVYAVLGMSSSYMLTGCGIPKLEKDADGNIVCRLGEYSDRAAQFYDKFNVIANNKLLSLSYSTASGLDPAGAAKYNDIFVQCRTMFAENHFLFCHTDLDAASREFIGMTKGFGLVPNPKFDTDQERYYHQVDTNALAWAVPNFADLDLAMIEDVFDYWAYNSHSTLMESFYEMSIKTKRASDPTTAGMIDIIKDSCLYFISDIYPVAGIDDLISKGAETSFATQWASKKTQITRALEQLETRVDRIPD